MTIQYILYSDHRPRSKSLVKSQAKKSGQVKGQTVGQPVTKVPQSIYLRVGQVQGPATPKNIVQDFKSSRFLARLQDF